MQNYIDDDEAEETLSFCDLQFCNDNDDNNASGPQEFSLENDQSLSSSLSSSSINDQDLFEFFSGWSSTSASFSFNTSTVSDDTNFRGELIPRNKIEFSHRKIPKEYSKSALLSSIKATTPRSNSSPVPAKYSDIPKGNYPGGRKDILSKRVSTLTSNSTTKSRWFMFMFGMSSSRTIPKKMELSDLRSRQSRRNRSTSTFCSLVDGGDEEVVGSGHHKINSVGKSSFGCFGGL